MRKQAAPLVLVVDDLSANVQLLGNMLDVAGYHVMPALNGREALTRAQQRAPDLVLLDLRMPDMDGFEVCKRLHELPGLADLPVIFVTAADEREWLSRAFEIGGVDYIGKPFLAEELLARVKVHIDLKRARDHLSALLREREDITNVVAHDLKNPLTCVRFAAQMLERTDRTAAPDADAAVAKRKELVDEILDCSSHALSFIQRYLSRSAEGEFQRKFIAGEADLLELAHESARFQRTSAGMREVELQVEGVSTPVHADAMAVRNVLQNLIFNALKYSPAGTVVSVIVDSGRAGYSRCRVLDRGPGISETDQKKLFQRFVRLAAAKTRTEDAGAEQSTGLGLAIAKNDVTQMGGYLWFESREGGGSVFAFELPHGAGEKAL